VGDSRENIKRVAFLAVLVVLLAGAILAIRGKADDTALPQAGQTAPNFTLPSQDGSNISLDNFRGKWVVLYFYPKDMTTGCTIEAHNFQQDMEKYQKLNAVVVGVSVDSTGSHKEFCAKEGLSFKLLSDQDKKVVAQYGSMGRLHGCEDCQAQHVSDRSPGKDCPGMDWRQPLAAQPAGFGRAERLREKRLIPQQQQVAPPALF
jgi:peroxiredoxin Q/BCP